MDTEHLQLFASVLRRGSFAAAARDHGVAPSTVSRAVSGLEEALGVRLLHRSTRHLEPTEAGAAWFAQIEPLLAGLEDAARLARDARQGLEGSLRVAAPVSFAQRLLLPWVADFCAAHPGLRLELALSDARVDLLAERVDLAIRLGTLGDSSLVARRLFPMRYVVAASPDYLARAGRPARPEALSERPCLVFPLPDRASTWRFRDLKGRLTEVPVSGPVQVDNSLALRQLALAGAGLAVLATWVIDDALASGDLVDVFPEHAVTATDFESAAWVILPTRAYVPRKVRAFIEALEARVSRGPPRT
ncbi:MAG: LysR family transcriptional regulator [Alphaproteobacteria bacterium]|nr:LysR family transcriptional regulator [Alphaproteobacteria bacterium]MCB9792883.1 LysR family transcriptional regulator [Alphaproteobacteria bacterium]